MKSTEDKDIITQVTAGEYKYGFVTDIETETIPRGLNEDVIRLVVLNEEIIGYIYPRRTSYVVALEIKLGRTTSLATSVNKQCMVLLSDKVRLATEQDFDDFHICFDGFRNNTMYCYNQGTEPIYLQ